MEMAPGAMAGMGIGNSLELTKLWKLEECNGGVVLWSREGCSFRSWSPAGRGDN